MLLFDTTRERARANVMKATRRGDLDAAERWMKIVERDLAIEERREKLANLQLVTEETELRQSKARHDLACKQEDLRQEREEHRIKMENWRRQDSR